MRFDCLDIFVDHKICVLGRLWLQDEKEIMESHCYTVGLNLCYTVIEYNILVCLHVSVSPLLNPVFLSGSHS